jgi:hypothetical protein
MLLVEASFLVVGCTVMMLLLLLMVVLMMRYVSLVGVCNITVSGHTIVLIAPAVESASR